MAADAPPNSLAGPFAIKFDRGFSPGQSFIYTMTHSERTIQTIDTPDGQTFPTQSYKTLTLDGDLTILKTDATGRETSVKLIVKRFTQQIDTGSTDTLLPPDSELTINYPAGAVTFTLATTATPGAPLVTPETQPALADQVQASLQQLFHAHAEHAVSEDDRFGITDKKSIGDTWPVNTKALATSSITADQISGTVTLRSTKNISNTDCLQLETRYAMRDIPTGQLPAGTQVRASAMNVLVATDLPIDTSRPKMGTAIKSNSHLIVEQRPNNAGILRTTIDSEITRVIAWTPKQTP